MYRPGPGSRERRTVQTNLFLPAINNDQDQGKGVSLSQTSNKKLLQIKILFLSSSSAPLAEGGLTSVETNFFLVTV